MKHWRTTLSGALLGGIHAVVAVVNYHELSNNQLILLFAMGAASVILGVLAKDSDASKP